MLYDIITVDSKAKGSNINDVTQGLLISVLSERAVSNLLKHFVQVNCDFFSM